MNKENVIQQEIRGAVFAIGSFDGVHLGHQKILQKALDIGIEQKKPHVLLTFTPNPKQTLYTDSTIFILTSPKIRKKILDFLDFHTLIECPFNEEFRKISAHEFVCDVLQKKLQAAHVVVGSNFHFGQNRTGTAAFLEAEGKKQGFETTIIEALKNEKEETISSSKIRQELQEGNVESAARLLNYHYTIEAKVIHGQQLGRTLGFPTANMMLSKQVQLKYGIYAVHFRLADGSILKGVANFGLRPTIQKNTNPLLETYIFNFSGDIYDQICEVSFFSFLRKEIKFDTIPALVTQMQQDSLQAENFLQKVEPISSLDKKICF